MTTLCSFIGFFCFDECGCGWLFDRALPFLPDRVLLQSDLAYPGQACSGQALHPRRRILEIVQFL
jgi:hypothetical protein